MKETLVILKTPFIMTVWDKILSRPLLMLSHLLLNL